MRSSVILRVFQSQTAAFICFVPPDFSHRLYLCACCRMEHNKENTKIFLYEEDAAFRAFLSALVQALGYPHVTCPGAFADSVEKFERAPDMDVCLIGLNTDGPEQNGLELARLVRRQAPFVPIIFLAKLYTEAVYAVCRPFSPSAFLNKELSGFKLNLALEQAWQHRSNGLTAPSEKNNQFLFLPQPLFLKTHEGFIPIPEQHILYFHSRPKTTRARTINQTYETSVHLQTLEAALQDNFVRIHKSYVININHIDAIQPNADSVTIGDDTLPIGHTFRKAFFNRVKLLR